MKEPLFFWRLLIVIITDICIHEILLEQAFFLFYEKASGLLLMLLSDTSQS